MNRRKPQAGLRKPAIVLIEAYRGCVARHLRSRGDESKAVKYREKSLADARGIDSNADMLASEHQVVFLLEARGH